MLLGHLHSKKAVGVHYCSTIDSDNTYGWDLFSWAKLQDCYGNSVFITWKQGKDVLIYNHSNSFFWIMSNGNWEKKKKNQAKQLEWMCASQKVSYGWWKLSDEK